MRRLEVLQRAAREHGTTLTLEVRIAPNHWQEATLPWPVPQDPFQPPKLDPSGVHTLLLIDVQFLDAGPTHHWWLSAELLFVSAWS